MNPGHWDSEAQAVADAAAVLSQLQGSQWREGHRAAGPSGGVRGGYPLPAPPHHVKGPSAASAPAVAAAAAAAAAGNGDAGGSYSELLSLARLRELQVRN